MCSEGLCFFSMGERYDLLLPLQCNSWAPVLPAFRERGSCYSLRSAKSGQEDPGNNSTVFSRCWCLSFPGWTSWILMSTSGISWIKNSAYHIKIQRIQHIMLTPVSLPPLSHKKQSFLPSFLKSGSKVYVFQKSQIDIQLIQDSTS